MKKQHYEKKYEGEKKLFETVEAAAKILQEEFTVCLSVPVLESYLFKKIRQS